MPSRDFEAEAPMPACYHKLRDYVPGRVNPTYGLIQAIPAIWRIVKEHGVGYG